MNNAPTMFYTPNQVNFMQQFPLLPGLNQQVAYNRCEFDLNFLVAFDLFEIKEDVYPLVISIQYFNKARKAFAFISYGVFTSNAMSEVDGARITKQLVLIEGVPYEIKSIYGLNLQASHKKDQDLNDLESLIGLPSTDDVAKSSIAKAKAVNDAIEKECLVCLSENACSIIMPCGHMCICRTCGDKLKAKAYTCPVCRGAIGSIITLDKS